MPQPAGDLVDSQTFGFVMTQSFVAKENRPQGIFPSVNPSIVRELGKRLALRSIADNAGDHETDSRSQEIDESLRFIERAGQSLAAMERSLNVLKSQANDLQRNLEETVSERNLLRSKLEDAERSLSAEIDRCEKANQLVKEHEAHSRKLVEQLRGADKKIADLTSAIANAFGSLESI